MRNLRMGACWQRVVNLCFNSDSISPVTRKTIQRKQATKATNQPQKRMKKNRKSRIVTQEKVTRWCSLHPNQQIKGLNKLYLKRNHLTKQLHLDRLEALYVTLHLKRLVLQCPAVRICFFENSNRYIFGRALRINGCCVSSKSFTTGLIIYNPFPAQLILQSCCRFVLPLQCHEQGRSKGKWHLGNKLV